MNNKLVGLSLSKCVADIIEDKVDVNDVVFIIARTAIKTPEDMDYVMHRYRKSYWEKNPDLGEKIARLLFEDNKVTQPRLRGDEPITNVYGIWIIAKEEL